MLMGLVCPAPCEDGCNRNEVDDFVGINAVEHHVGHYALEHGLKLPAPGEPTGKRVALIGGGVASLACAYNLRRKGHACTIFEARPELGGMVRYGIPGYRTPRDVLDGEIQRILDMGVEVRTGVKVGVDVTLDELAERLRRGLRRARRASGNAAHRAGREGSRQLHQRHLISGSLQRRQAQGRSRPRARHRRRRHRYGRGRRGAQARAHLANPRKGPAGKCRARPDDPRRGDGGSPAGRGRHHRLSASHREDARVESGNRTGHSGRREDHSLRSRPSLWRSMARAAPKLCASSRWIGRAAK